MGMITENLIRKAVGEVNSQLAATVAELRQMNANLKTVIALLNERK